MSDGDAYELSYSLTRTIIAVRIPFTKFKIALARDLVVDAGIDEVMKEVGLIGVKPRNIELGRGWQL